MPGRAYWTCLFTAVVFCCWVAFNSFEPRVSVENARRELAFYATELNRNIQGSGAGVAELNAILRGIRQNSGRILWIQVRTAQNIVIAHEGLGAQPTFSADYIRAQIRKQKPIYRIMCVSAGQVLVEAFPVELPRPLVRTASSEPRRIGIVEIAVLLKPARRARIRHPAI